MKNINLKINSGETVGIIGGTGSAKSTLVNLIPRFYDASEGKILVGETNVKSYDKKHCVTKFQWFFKRTCCSQEQ